MSKLHSSSECCTPALPLTTIQRTELGLIPVSPRHTHSPIDMSLSPALLEPLARLSSKRAVHYQEEGPHEESPTVPLFKVDNIGFGSHDADTLGSDLRAFGPIRQHPEVDTIPLTNKYSEKDITWDLDYSESNNHLDAEPCEPKPKTGSESGRRRSLYNTPRIQLDIVNSHASDAAEDSDLDRRPIMIFDSLPGSPAAEVMARPASNLSLSRLPLLDNASSCFDTTELSRFVHGNDEFGARAPSQGPALAAV